MAAGFESQIRIYNPKTGAEATSFRKTSVTSYQVTSLVVGPDRRLVAGCYDVIRVYNSSSTSNTPLNTINKPREKVLSMDYYFGGILAAGSGNYIRIFNLTDNCESLRNISAHSGQIYGVNLVSKNLLVSVSLDNRVRLWDIETGLA